MTPSFILRALLLGSLLSTFSVGVSAQTLVERLGYPPGTKLIIVHADDLGETHSVNAAAIKALQGGTINSASLMVPCPWFPEIDRPALQSFDGSGIHRVGFAQVVRMDNDELCAGRVSQPLHQSLRRDSDRESG